MIKLRNIDKYFNKGKTNQIHVINNTSLDLPENGLVTLLGESGSGKTTLLNVIGGLDKANGTIIFKDQVMKGYQSGKSDRLRNDHIGFVFQNYYLLDNKTVYDNIKLVLQMVGESDLDEIERKITYVLNAVGMYRFKNRLASDLSGGQKQRVAIARALVKNPDVIIADEPTGNLDTNNSIEIMKIIKEISRDKLVVLVTHNTKLASAYSDRIITIVDGSVNSDLENISSTDNLEYIDNNIYLGDLNSFENNQIKVYSNEDLTNLELTIVKINNNFYLQTSEKNITIKNVNKDNSIKLINDKRANILSTFKDQTDFKLSELESSHIVRNKKSYYSFKDSFIEALRKVTNVGKKAKFQLFAIIALSVVFTIAFMFLYSASVVDKSKNFSEKNIYVVNNEELPIEFYDDNYIIYNNNSAHVIFTQGHFTNNLSRMTLAPGDAINKNLARNEAIFDVNLLDDDYSDSYRIRNFGIYKKEHLININLSINNTYSLIKSNVTVIDSIDNNSHSLYVNSDVLLINSTSDYTYSPFYYFDIAFIEDDNIVIVHENTMLPNEGALGIYINEKYQNNLSIIEDLERNVNVLGFYEDNGHDVFYVYRRDLKEIVFKESNYQTTYIYSKDGNFPAGFEKVSIYDQNHEIFEDDLNSALSGSLTTSLITLGITVLIFFFLVRSSLSGRVKEISILRSLGLNKGSVIKLYLFEYLILTTFTSLIGVLIGSFISYNISNSIIGTLFNVRANLTSTLLAILAIYVANIAVALIPVILKLRQTPAQLLTNYDL